MTDRPIIFSAPMVLALLDGRKTQTRRKLYRLTKHLARATWDTRCLPPPLDLARPDRAVGEMWTLGGWQRVQPGDRLWVREAFSNTSGDDTMPVYYKADAPLEVAVSRKFQPSIHMPRWASRLTLTITDVRLQRLHEITEADARAEGWPEGVSDAAVPWFALLWQLLHGFESWGHDPPVVALTFTVDRCNIRDMPYQAAA